MKAKSHDFKYAGMFYTPAELSGLYLRFAEHIRTAPGLRWWIDSLDRAMIPLRPGNVLGIIGRPGHGKSSVTAYYAKRTAWQLVEEKRADKECVVYITYDQSVEEMEALFQADEEISVTDLASGQANMDAVRVRALQRVNLPIWTMGRSVLEKRHAPRMTISNVYEALRAMETEYGMHPALVCLDYIQIVPIEGHMDRNSQVTEAIVSAKELMLEIGSPMAMCVQATRAVDQRDDKIPTIGDCQWSSALEQESDKLLGILRPSLAYKDWEGRKIRYKGHEVPITPTTFMMRLEKQRFAPAGQLFLLDFAPQYVRLSDLELEAQPGAQSEEWVKNV